VALEGNRQPESITNPERFGIDSGWVSSIDRRRRLILLHFLKEGLQQSVSLKTATSHQPLAAGRVDRFLAQFK